MKETIIPKMEISKIITKIPEDKVEKYIGRKVLGYMIQEDKVLTSDSDILNSKYPIIKMVEGNLTAYNTTSFRSTFIIDDKYECDYIRIYRKEVATRVNKATENSSYTKNDDIVIAIIEII